jgi:hypothetical protein
LLEIKESVAQNIEYIMSLFDKRISGNQLKEVDSIPSKAIIHMMIFRGIYSSLTT